MHCRISGGMQSSAACDIVVRLGVGLDLARAKIGDLNRWVQDWP